MSIHEYVRSIAATQTVTKSQLFRYLEIQFSRLDSDHDGELDLDELSEFVRAVALPEADRR